MKSATALFVRSQEMPILLNVPNFEEVRIHGGNTAADTLGCILVGRSKGADRITESKPVFAVEAFRTATGLSTPMLLNASVVATDYETTNDRLIVVDKLGYIQFKGNQSAIKDIEAVKLKVNELLAK